MAIGNNSYQFLICCPLGINGLKPVLCSASDWKSIPKSEWQYSYTRIYEFNWVPTKIYSSRQIYTYTIIFFSFKKNQFSIYKLIQDVIYFVKITKKMVWYLPPVQHNSRPLRSVDQSTIYTSDMLIMCATFGVCFKNLPILFDFEISGIQKTGKMSKISPLSIEFLIATLFRSFRHFDKTQFKNVCICSYSFYLVLVFAI